MSAAAVNLTFLAMLAGGPAMPESGDNPVLYSTQLATIVAPSAELRADASVLQPVVGRLHQGERAVVIFVQGDWVKVRHADDCEGWVERTLTSTCFEQLEIAQIRQGIVQTLPR